MSLIDQLQDLVLDGWRFWLDNGRLKYRAPKNALSPALLQKLKQNKPDIIHLLQTAPEKLDVCPLSYGQRALWFLWKLSPQSSAYNQSLPIRVHHEVVEADWQRGCSRLVARHPLLRTVFPSSNGEPLQQVRLPTAPDWTAVDARGWDEARLLAEMARVHERPFDLEQCPAVRFHWFDRPAGETILLITMHHIICDGWSLEIMRRELPYLCAPNGHHVDLPLPDYTYHDYVRWHLQLLQGDAGQRLWDFWREQLNGRLPIIDLPTDYQRPLIQTYQGAACNFTLLEPLTQQIRELAQAEGATLYETFLAVFLILLYRLSGQKDILVGSPTAGRSRTEFATIVGYFVNPVVIRSLINEGDNFRTFLANVRRITRQALAHADFPFPLLVEKLSPEREANRSPIFDVTFNYLNRATAEVSTNEQIIEVFDIPQADGKFDLTLTLLEDADGIRGSFGYNLDLFDQATVSQFAVYFKTMLSSIVDAPDEALENIRLQQGATRRPALSGPQRDLTAQDLFHRLFETQAAARPQALAVSDQDVTLKYAELNAQANSLGRHLRSLGIGIEDRVAICTGRSVAFVVAMLAVLKAGAAYVPLEPTQPAELRDYMMNHAGVAALLTQSRLQLAPPALAVPVIDLDAFLAPANTSTQVYLNVPVGLENLAYVMYTSGSTGRPKGVAIEHTALANYVASIMEDLAMLPHSNFALASTFGADLGNTVIFPALASGGCLHILSEEERLDRRRFSSAMRARSIDYLKIVPSHLAALLGGENAHLALPKRAVFLGGEGTAVSWIQHLQKQVPGCQFYNHYGPTEATIGVLTYQVDPEQMPSTSATLPLNKAVANTDIFILDQHLQSVPPGVIGELYIGGRCLAREYINDPQRTSESFIQVRDVHSGSVLYKTGDLARQRPNGDIELLGRSDRQIKLRGYRIELAQIEAIMRTHPTVGQSVVLANNDGHQVQRLIAYVVAQSAEGAEIPAERLIIELQQYLQQKLPPYMIPSHILLLEELPLTANGKLDTHALRLLDSPALSQSIPDALFPRDLVELKLSQIWSEVLSLPHVGLHDDFFQLGGHSLLAVRLTGYIEREFQQWVPLATLFTHPTIAKLAHILRSTDKTAGDSIMVPIKAQGDNSPLFFLPGAGGSVMYFSDLANRLGRDQPVWGLQALGLTGHNPIPQDIKEIASSYIARIRQSIQPEGPYRFIGHSFGGLVAYEMARQLLAQGQPIHFLGILDNAAPASAPSDLYANYGHTEWLLHIATRIGKLNRIDLQLNQDDLAGKRYSEQIELIIDRLIAENLLPVDLNKSYFRQFIEVYKANAFAAVHYRPEQLPLSMGITLFKAQEMDPVLGAQATSKEQTLGWDRYAATVEVIDVPGTHLSMFSEPHVIRLAETIRDRLRGEN
ncbi:MAG: amino acid adenylation domain-containing protein [Candidatus Promineifilaceae bacterium]|nr:amino acid adenylation domain-containing protein [Candidatus Promineifilaceae bacterium]